MRILFVDPWGLAGITTCYAHLARYFTARGDICDAFCYMQKWPDGYMLKPYCRQMVQAPATLTEMLSRNQYDVVHLSACCFPYPLSAAVHISRARFQGAVIVMSQQPIEYEIPPGVAHALVGVSESSAAALRTKNEQEVHLIYNGIDTEMFSPSSVTDKAPRPILGWIGRAGDLKQKDVSGFLYLASALRESDYDFWIVDGEQEIQQHMQRLPDWFGGRIRYTHKMDYAQVPEFYRTVAASGGAVVSTSAWEAMAFAILEAWACGCPTIVPNAPGFEHCARYGASLVYDRSDAVSQILTHLASLNDPNQRSRLIQAAQAAVQTHFTNEHMAKSYLKLYEQSLGASRSVGKTSAGDHIFRRFWCFHSQVRRALPRRMSTTN